MLRAILKQVTFDANNGLSTADTFTIDFENQKIEEALCAGNSGIEFIGIEFLEDDPDHECAILDEGKD